MNRSQWIKYITIVDKMSELKQISHDQKVKIIDGLIEAERKEWNQIELENAGLIKTNKSK
tara:strand:+ start:153 stop:332 length:180 start_codon:yes stop_codon:yes gene_type:complete